MPAGLDSNTNGPGGRLSRTFGVLGLVGSGLVGLSMVTVGALGLLLPPSYSVDDLNNTNSTRICRAEYDSFVPNLNLDDLQYQRSYFRCISINNSAPIFLLIVLVTICTESIGFVHATTLRWRLVHERRIQFHHNVRLFTISNDILSANGAISNAMMATFLILSFAAGNATFLHTSDGENVVYLPVIILLGVALLLQTAIATWGVFTTGKMSWSNNPFNFASSLVRDGVVRHRSGKCLRGLGHPRGTSPVQPSQSHPSLWQSKRSVRWIFLSFCIFVLGTLALFVALIAKHSTRTHFRWTWTNTTSEPSAFLRFLNPKPAANLILAMIFIAAIQSVLTISLHFCELLTGLSRDEALWRKASSKCGLTLTSSSLTVALSSPPSMVLLLMKPVLHWFFGQAVSLHSEKTWNDNSSTGGASGIRIRLLQNVPSVHLYAPQALNLLIASSVFAVFLAFLAFRRPHGHQPVSYGHMPTLIDCVDAWPKERVYWGHKGYADRNREVYHAGTSSKQLPLTLIEDGKGYK